MRKLSGSILNKTFTAINNCGIAQIEFFENNTYLINISYNTADSSELSYHTFKGKFNLVFKDSDAESIIERIVFIGQNYEPISIVPTQGSVATISEIVIDARSHEFLSVFNWNLILLLLV